MADRKVREIETTSPEKMAFLHGLLQANPGSAARAQTVRLFQTLKGAPINSAEVRVFLDIYHPPARILQLRKRGFEIRTDREHVETADGETRRVGRYCLMRQSEGGFQ